MSCVFESTSGPHMSRPTQSSGPSIEGVYGRKIQNPFWESGVLFDIWRIFLIIKYQVIFFLVIVNSLFSVWIQMGHCGALGGYRIKV